MRPNDSVQIFADKYLENIMDTFKTLYAEEQLSDVILCCKEGSIKAHKLILAASSPYFYKIFREYHRNDPVVLMYGITLNNLKSLMELLYRGIVDVPNNDVEIISNLVEEFEIKGVVFGMRASNNVRIELNQSSHTSPESAHNRDTRFKGQKRVAVDFTYEGERCQSRAASTSSVHSNENKQMKRSSQEDVIVHPPLRIKTEVASPIPSSEPSTYNLSESITMSPKKTVMENGAPRLNAWARKQRKFKCNLCPSSFKRSSHLSRHQLVHTGERPYSCSQCDKAFSRHDKLKHHVRKAHEFIPDSMYERIDNEDMRDSEPESSERNYSMSLHNGSVANGPSNSNAEYGGPPSPKIHRENSPLFTISHISTILEDSFVTPPKKGRGRPRKYPPATERVQTWISSVSEQPAYKEETTAVENHEIFESEPRCKQDVSTNGLEYGPSEFRDNEPPISNAGNVEKPPLFSISHVCTIPEKCSTSPMKLRRKRKPLIPFSGDANADKQSASGARSRCSRVNRGKGSWKIKLKSIEKRRSKRNRDKKRKPKTISSPSIVFKRRGRSSKTPKKSPVPAIKRGRGRPKLNQVVLPYPRPGTQNYDITNLPYGDLNYLTSQLNTRPTSIDEGPVMIEPLVEINTEQPRTSRSKESQVAVNNSENVTEDETSFMEQAVIEPFVEIQTDNIKSETIDQSSNHYPEVNISEIETKIGLIGECTISVAN